MYIRRPAMATGMTTGTTTHAFILNQHERDGLDHHVAEDVELVVVPVPRRHASALRSLAAQVQGQALAADEVADVLERVGQVPSAATVAALTRMEQRWRDMQERHGLLTGAEVADLAGSRAQNRSELGSSLARQGQVVAVRRAGRALYPGFQFTEHGKPRPVVADVVRLLRGADWSDESIVLWFDAPNGYLDDRHPADLLEAEPDAVRDAATQAAARASW